MKKKVVKRSSSYMRYNQSIELKVKPVFIWAYDGDGKFVARIGINGAGLSIYGGAKGKKFVCDASWETLLKKLTPK